MIKPEYEKQFYIASIASMCLRYEAKFNKRKMNWKSYFKHVIKQIGQRIYTIWIFLCGLEPVMEECLRISDRKKRKEMLMSSTKKRIWLLLREERIMKDYLENI